MKTKSSFVQVQSCACCRKKTEAIEGVLSKYRCKLASTDRTIQWKIEEIKHKKAARIFHDLYICFSDIFILRADPNLHTNVIRWISNNIDKWSEELPLWFVLEDIPNNFFTEEKNRKARATVSASRSARKALLKLTSSKVVPAPLFLKVYKKSNSDNDSNEDDNSNSKTYYYPTLSLPSTKRQQRSLARNFGGELYELRSRNKLSNVNHATDFLLEYDEDFAPVLIISKSENKSRSCLRLFWVESPTLPPFYSTLALHAYSSRHQTSQ